MDKKGLIQYAILLVVLFLISYIYLNYFRVSVEEIKNINNIKKTEKSLPKTSKDLISDLVYSSVDRKGNKYKIESKEGEITSENKNVIIMNNVTAEISLINGEKIYISSKKAKYNNDNFDTFFQGSVKMKYIYHSIDSENLELSFENQQAKLYNQVVYKNRNSELIADIIFFDFLNMSTKFLMDDKNKNILVKSVINNGNN
tara:strand:+ start:205 stop:807 length:603 start_codon:yes stop_codon:yes gene_type:complete